MTWPAVTLSKLQTCFIMRDHMKVGLLQNFLNCHTNTHVPAYLINIRLILIAPEEKLLPTARVVKSPVLLTVRCSPAPPP